MSALRGEVRLHRVQGRARSPPSRYPRLYPVHAHIRLAGIPHPRPHRGWAGWRQVGGSLNLHQKPGMVVGARRLVPLAQESLHAAATMIDPKPILQFGWRGCMRTGSSPEVMACHPYAKGFSPRGSRVGRVAFSCFGFD